METFVLSWGGQTKLRKHSMSRILKTQPAGEVDRIFIVEDHPAFREGLVQIINTEEGLTVCGEAGTSDEALEKISLLEPELALVDITLPGKSGLELIKEIRAKGLKTKLLVVSMHDEALYANRVLRAGGDGYIMKQEDPDELINAIHDVLDGHIYVSEKVLASRTDATPAPESKANPLDQLTDSELEILEMFGQGKSNEEIAKRFSMDLAGVEQSARQLREKLGLDSHNALIRFAVCWIEAPAG
jgi:DNA-binding NarL/FixJ family response regulator